MTVINKIKNIAMKQDCFERKHSCEIFFSLADRAYKV